MVACGCFSAGTTATKRPATSEYVHQESFPKPPAIFQHDDTKDIYNRLSEAIPPIEAERSTAVVNKKAKRSIDFNEEAGRKGSRHALLADPSGGFTRTSSIGFGSNRTSFDLRRSISDRGVQPASVAAAAAAAQGWRGPPSTGPPAGSSGDMWSESRKELELAIQAEKAKDHADWNPDLQSEEQRLRKRLSKLNLEMKVMIGDGNCQFRAVSFGLYGSQEYHYSVRQKAVEYMRAHKELYEAFLGENIDEYLDSMAQSCTWGDELTLRAISDYWGIVINVVTSDQHNWFMRYKPPKIRILLEIFLTYIAPVHYNAIRRQTVTGALRSTLSRQTSSSIDLAMKRAFSAERALATTRLAPEVQDALRTGRKFSTPAEDAQPSGAAEPVPAHKDVFQRRRGSEKMDSVLEAVEERTSMNSSVLSASSPRGRDLSPTSPSGSEPMPRAEAIAGGVPAVTDAAQSAETSPSPVAAGRVPLSAFAAEASQPLSGTYITANGHGPVQLL